MADAWCDFENSINRNGDITESEQYIKLVLRHRAEHGTLDEEEGGAK